MKRIGTIITALLLTFGGVDAFAQGVQVSTLVPDINANGGMAVGPDGKLYVADAYAGNYDFGGAAVGSSIYRVSADGSFELFVDGLTGPLGLAFEPAGDLFVTQIIGPNFSGNSILRITPSGGVSTHVSSMLNPLGIAVRSDGSLLVAECPPPGARTTVKRITPTRIPTEFSRSSLLNCPTGVAFDHDENLYVSNTGNGRIIRIDPAGVATELARVPSSAAQIVFANDHLYVTSQETRIVYQVSLAGEVIALAGSGDVGTQDGPALSATFGYPLGLAASVTGDTLYVGDNSVPEGSVAHPNLIRMITGVHSAVATANESGSELPEAVTLGANYPNPFNPSTMISFEMDRAEAVRLSVFDLLGREVAVLVDGIITAGAHEVSFDAVGLTSGVYLYRIAAASGTQTRSMQLVK